MAKKAKDVVDETICKGPKEETLGTAWQREALFERLGEGSMRKTFVTFMVTPVVSYKNVRLREFSWLVSPRSILKIWFSRFKENLIRGKRKSV